MYDTFNYSFHGFFNQLTSLGGAPDMIHIPEQFVVIYNPETCSHCEIIPLTLTNIVATFHWLVVWNISYFSIYWEFHHPNWLIHIFKRGRWLNHQPVSTSNVLVMVETWKRPNFSNEDGNGSLDFSEFLWLSKRRLWVFEAQLQPGQLWPDKIHTTRGAPVW